MYLPDLPPGQGMLCLSTTRPQGPQASQVEDAYWSTLTEQKSHGTTTFLGPSNSGWTRSLTKTLTIFGTHLSYIKYGSIMYGQQ